jgi:hypothetical protein
MFFSKRNSNVSFIDMPVLFDTKLKYYTDHNFYQICFIWGSHSILFASTYFPEPE